MKDDEPLIWTSKGNLAISSLTARVVWTDNECETICASELWLGDECVRREIHVYKRVGAATQSVTGEQNG
jgi:hypothetical protein